MTLRRVRIFSGTFIVTLFISTKWINVNFCYNYSQANSQGNVEMVEVMNNYLQIVPKVLICKMQRNKIYLPSLLTHSDELMKSSTCSEVRDQQPGNKKCHEKCDPVTI